MHGQNAFILNCVTAGTGDSGGSSNHALTYPQDVLGSIVICEDDRHLIAKFRCDGISNATHIQPLVCQHLSVQLNTQQPRRHPFHVCKICIWHVKVLGHKVFVLLYDSVLHSMQHSSQDRMRTFIGACVFVEKVTLYRCFMAGSWDKDAPKTPWNVMYVY